MKIFQGLKILFHESFDIMIFDIDAQDIEVLYALKIAKELNKNLHLIVLSGDKEFFPLRNIDKTKIDHLQFKPVDFNRLKFHLDCLITGGINNGKQLK